MATGAVEVVCDLHSSLNNFSRLKLFIKKMINALHANAVTEQTRHSTQRKGSSYEASRFRVKPRRCASQTAWTKTQKISIVRRSFQRKNECVSLGNERSALNSAYYKQYNRSNTARDGKPPKRFLPKASVDNAESIARKVTRTANACKTLGRWGFWAQLILFTVAAVVVVFSFLFKGLTKATDAGLYFILFGIMAGFFTTFWSLGLVRLGDRLKASVKDLDLVSPRAEVVKALTTGLTVNLVGLGATLVGLQATTGLLFAKTLTVAATGPFASNANPVLALDIFLVQAASNAMLAHWLGLSISLWLLRTVNLPSPPAPKGEK